MIIYHANVTFKFKFPKLFTFSIFNPIKSKATIFNHSLQLLPVKSVEIGMYRLIQEWELYLEHVPSITTPIRFLLIQWMVIKN